MVHEIHVLLRSYPEEIRKLQEKNLHCDKLIENMNFENKWCKGDYSLDPHGTLYKKVKYNGKEFRVLIVPKNIQKYVLYETHNSLGHNGTTGLYQLVKRLYYWKGLKESVQRFVRHNPNTKQQIYKHQKCANTSNSIGFYFNRLHWPNRH